MKKFILGTIMFLTLTTQAEAKFYEKDVLTFNAGKMDSSVGIDRNIYGFSIFQAKGAGKFGWAGGMDLYKDSDSFNNIKVEKYLFAPNLGFSYGITNGLYIVPTIGLSMATEDWTEKTENEEGETEEENVFSDSHYGPNIGADLMYKFKNGFVFGLGGKVTRLDGMTVSQVQAKIGFSFK